jgi:hypothetical protein
MDNFTGRRLITTAAVFATAMIAGTAPRFSPGIAAAADGSPSIEESSTALAIADAHCDPTLGPATILGESCNIPGGGPEPTELPEEDYEPAWMAGLRKLDIPFKSYPRIERFVHYWSASPEGRKIFRTWLRRSGKYRHEVDKALAARKLPLDLAALVFVESGFSPTAKSKAGAVGLWQFMPATARDYGLVITKDYDERRSVVKSSEAAVDHLASLYGKLGEWELVFAAYDMGARALSKKQDDFEAHDYWKLSEIDGALPGETVRYVPQILAFALVLKNLDRFGYDTIKLETPIMTSDLDVPAGVPLGLVARAAGTSLSHLRELNPEILGQVVPDAASVVHVPSAGLARARVMLPHLLFDMDESGGSKGAGDFDWGTETGAEPTEPALPARNSKGEGGRAAAVTRGEGKEAALAKK